MRRATEAVAKILGCSAEEVVVRTVEDKPENVSRAGIPFTRRTLPTINVDFLDSRVTPAQKRQLAKPLTKILSETLGYSEVGVTIIFRSTSAGNIARDGRLCRRRRY